ncbi:NADH-ubiquinone oxidoreductase chain J [hydrothermal vent metagenome]|uniref:NADH-ubiquinone oxidoreductase chain J n=1 Tax=hydrothermal vent metagenome TaxID=652676 RepID=A0A3B1B5W2_9ZZZZ
MGIEKIIFYVFAAILIFSAGSAMSTRNPVYAAMYLVLSFFSCSALWLLLEAEFLAIVLVLVYVGAVMVLFLFVVMMLDINIARMKQGFMKFLPVGVGFAILMAGMMIFVLLPEHWTNSQYKLNSHPAEYNNTAELGKLLYTKYVYQFEIAAAILLVAIVAAIALTLRRRPNTRHQNIDNQISVKRKDRIRMVDIKSEQRK